MFYSSELEGPSYILFWRWLSLASPHSTTTSFSGARTLEKVRIPSKCGESVPAGLVSSIVSIAASPRSPIVPAARDVIIELALCIPNADRFPCRPSLAHGPIARLGNTTFFLVYGGLFTVATRLVPWQRPPPRHGCLFRPWFRRCSWPADRGVTTVADTRLRPHRKIPRGSIPCAAIPVDRFRGSSVIVRG